MYKLININYIRMMNYINVLLWKRENINLSGLGSSVYFTPAVKINRLVECIKNDVLDILQPIEVINEKQTDTKELFKEKETEYDKGWMAGYYKRKAEELMERCYNCAEYHNKLKECSMGFLDFIHGEDLEAFTGSNFGCCFWHQIIKKERKKK